MIIVLTLASLRRYDNGIGIPNTNEHAVVRACCWKKDDLATNKRMKIRILPSDSTM